MAVTPFLSHGPLTVAPFSRADQCRLPTGHYMPCVRLFPSTHAIPLVSRFPNNRQLRDLIICPDERGVVNYVQDRCIMEHDISDPSSVSLFTLLFSLSRLALLRAAPFPVVERKKKKEERNGSLEKKGGEQVP